MAGKRAAYAILKHARVDKFIPVTFISEYTYDLIFLIPHHIAFVRYGGPDIE
jgi:hypothetical protein